MKLNNKGFAISTVMYLILVLAIILVTSTLLILSNRKLIVDKQKSEVLNSIYKICKPVTNETASRKSNGTLIGNIPTGMYNLGDEYICNVDGQNKYHFYVLSKNGDEINLILDRTVSDNGELSIKSGNSVTAWRSQYIKGSISDGPVTAFDFLHKATSNWSNIPSLSINYIYSGESYSVFKTNSRTVFITNSDNNEMSNYKNLRARLPFQSEISNAGCTSAINSCPLWLSNYLISSSSVIGGKNISGIMGYWTIPTNTSELYLISYEGNLCSSNPYGGMINEVVIGVRPVITLLKSNISS